MDPHENHQNQQNMMKGEEKKKTPNRRDSPRPVISSFAGQGLTLPGPDRPLRDLARQQQRLEQMVEAHHNRDGSDSTARVRDSLLSLLRPLDSLEQHSEKITSEQDQAMDQGRLDDDEKKKGKGEMPFIPTPKVSYGFMLTSDCGSLRDFHVEGEEDPREVDYRIDMEETTVRAILHDRKSHMRRIARPRPTSSHGSGKGEMPVNTSSGPSNGNYTSRQSLQRYVGEEQTVWSWASRRQVSVSADDLVVDELHPSYQGKGKMPHPLRQQPYGYSYAGKDGHSYQGKAKGKMPPPAYNKTARSIGKNDEDDAYKGVGNDATPAAFHQQSSFDTPETQGSAGFFNLGPRTSSQRGYYTAKAHRERANNSGRGHRRPGPLPSSQNGYTDQSHGYHHKDGHGKIQAPSMSPGYNHADIYNHGPRLPHQRPGSNASHGRGLGLATSVDSRAGGPFATAAPSSPFRSKRSRPDDDEEEEEPDEINDWAVERRDGVYIGRPPPVPATLLDWTEQDRGKRVGDVSTSTLQRAQAAATSAYGVARGAVQGVMGGFGAGIAGPSGTSHDGSIARKEKEERSNERDGRKKRRKNGKFVSKGREQESREYYHSASDNCDSDDSTWQMT